MNNNIVFKNTSLSDPRYKFLSGNVFFIFTLLKNLTYYIVNMTAQSAWDFLIIETFFCNVRT